MKFWHVIVIALAVSWLLIKALELAFQLGRLAERLGL